MGVHDIFSHNIFSADTIIIYCINTSEIPSELFRENFISSHVKGEGIIRLNAPFHCFEQTS